MHKLLASTPQTAEEKSMYLGVTNSTLERLREEKQSPYLSAVVGTPAEFHHRDHVSPLN